jgi:F0F1-type ATP synthase assembly protein I
VKPDRHAYYALGLIGSIGFTVSAGVLVGYWIGSWADRTWKIEPWGLLTGLLLSLAGAALECWLILRLFAKSEARKGPPERR